MHLESALTQLMPELRAYARSICTERADAEDLVGDAVERALTARNHPRDLKGLRPWMFRIIRNLHIDEMRKRRVHGRYSDDAGSAGPDAFQHTTLDDVLTRIAFEKLTPQHREILYLVDVTGLKYAEAADVLEIAPGTVMSRLSRARRALLELIDDTNVTALKAGGTKGRG